MSQALIVDGLWYCLCPSFRHSLLARSFVSLTPQRAPLGSRALWSSKKLLESDHGIRDGSEAKNDKIFNQASFDTAFRPKHHENPQTLVHEGEHEGNSETLKWGGKGALIQRTVGVPEDLQHRSTSNLESMLQQVIAKSPNMIAVTAILRVLIRDRHVRPQVRHYRALILANTDGKHGSPDNVRKLLKEMEGNGIAADSGTLHSALQVLAVHPDYLLRQDIIRTLHDRWLPLSPAGWHHLVAGLIREHQFELALNHIDLLERKGIYVETWLHCLLVYNLCDIEEFDQVLALMKSRMAQDLGMTMNLWLHVLDVASEALHLAATKYAWKQVVELGFLNPSHGICSNVLTVASRTGDTELGASVIRFFAETEVPLSSEDYEKLAETYVMAGDIYEAFKVLCSMEDSGSSLAESSTRSILTYLIRTRTKPLDAWSMLKRLKASKRKVPIGCANVVIELCEHATAYDPYAADEAIKFYKELYALCSIGANVVTYNSLIATCRHAKNTEACMFVVKEMAALGVTPDSTTFERLILICLDSGNFRSGYMYFQDLIDRGLILSESARDEICNSCQDLNDEFAVRLSLHPLVRMNVPIRNDANILKESEATEDTAVLKQQPVNKHREGLRYL
ncbi:hypothetical protein V8E54_006054 [Elaphomyces granulatus]